VSSRTKTKVTQPSKGAIFIQASRIDATRTGPARKPY
jgi:hypothetical protein